MKVPSREGFGEVAVEGFSYDPGKVKVEYWTCCLVQQENTSGQYYHVQVKLSDPKRWNPVKTYLAERYGICVHFSESSATYYAAFKYISKTDKNVYESPNHPDLKEVDSPKTKKCINAYRETCRKNKSVERKKAPANEAKHPKVKILRNLEVSDFIVSKNVKTDTEPFAQGSMQKEADKKELANFVMSRSSKALQDLITNLRKMNGAVEELLYLVWKPSTRLQIISVCNTAKEHGFSLPLRF